MHHFQTVNTTDPDGVDYALLPDTDFQSHTNESEPGPAILPASASMLESHPTSSPQTDLESQGKLMMLYFM